MPESTECSSKLPSSGRRRIGMLGAALLAGACREQRVAAQTATKNTSKVPSAPALITRPYHASFSDDFDLGSVARINENASGGTADAPAWRSRFRQPRKDIINQEKQIYVDAAYTGTGSEPLGLNPFVQHDGVLHIIAEPTDPDRTQPHLYGMAYTSGCITSELTHSQQYGFFEMRAKFPVGRGFWPAFWLMPVRNTWPPEIDIVEASGSRPGKYHFAVRDPGDKKGRGSGWLSAGDVSQNWHTYGCEWSAERIVFFVDSRKTWQVDGHQVHEPMYLLANLALGSHDQYWIPNPDASTPFPADMQIDYIRAWQRPPR